MAWTVEKTTSTDTNTWTSPYLDEPRCDLQAFTLSHEILIHTSKWSSIILIVVVSPFREPQWPHTVVVS